jgi:hypothetical protein
MLSLARQGLMIFANTALVQKARLCFAFSMPAISTCNLQTTLHDNPMPFSNTVSQVLPSITSIDSVAKVRWPCCPQARLLFANHRFSVKKGLTRPPSAIPSTINDDGVQPGQVKAHSCITSFFQIALP